MKFAIALCCLALFVATATSECDPDAEGVPDCTGLSGSQKYRNNWDPTHYFVCNNGVAVSMPCQPVNNLNTGFDAKVGDCVVWSEWDWYAVC